MNITPVLPDERMRALGFTDRDPDKWYLFRNLDSGTTLNVTVVKDTGEWEELVMDEFCGQPAFYGQMTEPFQTVIREGIDSAVSEFRAAGLTVNVDHSDYVG